MPKLISNAAYQQLVERAEAGDARKRDFDAKEYALRHDLDYALKLATERENECGQWADRAVAAERELAKYTRGLREHNERRRREAMAKLVGVAVVAPDQVMAA